MAGWVHLHFQVVYILFVCVKCEELEELDLQILLARDCSKYVLILVRYNGAASKVSQSIFPHWSCNPVLFSQYVLMSGYTEFIQTQRDG